MVTVMLESPTPYTPSAASAPINRPDAPAVLRTPNPSAWEALLLRRDDAYLLALRVLGNSADAEDVVQEAYVRALKSARQIPAGLDGWHWFQRVIINTARDSRTAERRRASREQAVAAQAAELTRSRGEAELRDAVADAMQMLDAEVRTILCLHYEQDLPYYRAAELLGANEGTLRATASRGIQALRDRLARNGYHVASAAVIGTLSGGLGIKAPGTLVAAVQGLKGASSAAGWGAAELGSSVAGKALITIALLVGTLALIGRSPQLKVHRPIAAASPAPFVANGDEQTAPPAVESDVPEPESISPALAAILKRKVNVVYRRDFLSEMMNDLTQQTGLRAAYPEPLERSFLTTLTLENTSVETVLRTIAKKANLKLEFHGDTVVFWREEAWLDLVGMAIKARSLDKNERREVLHEVARVADKRIYPILFTLALDEDPTISADALAQLSLHHLRELRYGAGVKRIVPGLLKQVNPKSAATNRALLNVVAATGDPRVAPLLIPLLKDSDSQVRDYVANALIELSADDAEKFLPPLLADADPNVRAVAAVALAWCGGARFFQPVRALMNDPDTGVRTLTGSALALIAFDPEVRAWLLDELKHPSPETAGALANAFQQIREPAAVPDLVKLLNDDDNTVQYYVALALGFSRDPRAIEPLIAVLQGADKSVAQQAAWALGMIRDDAQIPRLTTMLTDADPQVRVNAAVALSTFRTHQVVPSLIRLQKDASPIVRSQLAVALLQVFDSETTDVLRELLHDPDANVRAETAKELGRSGDSITSFIDDLIKLVDDEDPHVRASALIGLAQITKPNAVDAVIRALDDKDDTVRATADAVLSQCHSYLPGIDKIVEKARAAHRKAAPKPPAPPAEF